MFNAGMINMPSFSGTDTFAFSACSSANSGDASIAGAIQMPVRATSNQLRAPKMILLLRDSLQMFRIYTKAITTKVVNCDSLWYRTFRQFIGKPMDTDIVITNPKVPISRICDVPYPYPTGISLANRVPEAELVFVCGRTSPKNVTPSDSIVSFAQSFAMNHPAAVGNAAYLTHAPSIPCGSRNSNKGDYYGLV